MNQPPEEPGRKALPHLPSREYPNQSIIQFVNCNAAGRRPLLVRPEIHQVILSASRKANHWLGGRYFIMPDHLHRFCAPQHLPATPHKRWKEFWQVDATRNGPYPGEKPIWQKDFFDRQLRSGESYRQKWQYQLQNPVKAKLVARWEEWPDQGELNLLHWHENDLINTVAANLSSRHIKSL